MESLNERIQNIGRAALVSAMNADREAESLLKQADQLRGRGSLRTDEPTAHERECREKAARLEALAVESRRVAEYAQRGILFASQNQVRTGQLFRDPNANQTFSEALDRGLVVWEGRDEAAYNSEANSSPYPRTA